MKKQRHWLDFVEYASLISLGVGSVASFLSSQLLYTSAPLSLLVLLNLASRRRMEQQTEQSINLAVTDLDGKFSKNIELLHQHLSELPTPEDMGSLKKSLLIKNREVLEKLSSDITALQKDIQERFSSLDKQNFGVIRQEINRVEGQYHNLAETVMGLSTRLSQITVMERIEDVEGAIAQIQGDTAQLRSHLQSLSEQTKPTLTSLQDQINHLNRQFQKLPPPFDSTALKQEVSELIRVVAELVPKRDWQNLLGEVKSLQQQQESRSQSEETFRRKMQDLHQQIQSRPVKANLTSLQNQINHLNRQLQKLPPPFDPSSLKREIGELIKAVSHLVPKRDWSALVAQVKSLQQQQEFQRQLDETMQRELQNLTQQLQHLSRPVPQIVADVEPSANFSDDDTAFLEPPSDFQTQIERILQRELRELDRQFQLLPTGPQLQAEIEATLRQELQDVNEQLRQFSDEPHYELVFDFKGSHPELTGASSKPAIRQALEEALDCTENRLILILPWSELVQLDDGVMQQFEAFLNQGKQLHVGWCHQVNRDETRFLSPINQRWAIHPLRQGVQSTLQRLLQLKRSRPEQFQFKILGTDENFLVVDDRFAVLGINDSVTATTVFSNLELKLRTDDADVVQQCIQRFEQDIVVEDDPIAFWKQAVTRYDLGDREGALADFNQILDLNTEDVAAYNHRGLVRYDLGDYEGSIADFSHSLTVNPLQVAAYCNRGFLRSESGDQLGAIADYSLAIQQQPDSAIAYFYRGMACQKYNDPLAAITDFNDTIRLVPDSAIAYYYRAQSHQKLENFRSAIADFETAARLFLERGNKTNAQKALKNLARLKQHSGQQTLSQSDMANEMDASAPQPIPDAPPYSSSGTEANGYLPIATPVESMAIAAAAENRVPAISVERHSAGIEVDRHQPAPVAAIPPAQSDAHADTLEHLFGTVEISKPLSSNGSMTADRVEVALEPVPVIEPAFNQTHPTPAASEDRVTGSLQESQPAIQDSLNPLLLFPDETDASTKGETNGNHANLQDWGDALSAASLLSYPDAIESETLADFSSRF